MSCLYFYYKHDNNHCIIHYSTHDRRNANVLNYPKVVSIDPNAPGDFGRDTKRRNVGTRTE